MTQTYRSFPQWYALNIRNGHRIAAREAIIETPNGEEEPGVVFSLAEKVVAVIPHSAAFRIAKDMADILTKQKQTPQHTPSQEEDPS